MEKPFSKIVEETRSNIIKDINESGLHPAIIFYLMKDLLHDVSKTYEDITIKENKEYQLSLKDAEIQEPIA